MLEIACFNKESAYIAEKNGADRIEFCADIKEGGTTPDFKEFIEIKSAIKIPIFVMIRPRGGDFIYSDEEFMLMKNQISKFKSAGADGFVFGILTTENQVDINKNSELVKLASPIPCTFHRAFDRLDNLEKSLENVVACGFKTILTSGQKPNVDEGKDNIKTLVRLSSNRIEILVGGGLRSKNLIEIKDFTCARSFHSSGIINKEEIADGEEISSIKSKIG